MSPQPPGGSSTEEPPSFLETVEGELSFFRSIMRARPVGIHRHFHVLAMRSNIHKDTGRWVSIEDIWEKLRKCYDLEALDAIDVEAEGYSTPQTSKSTPVSIKSPSPSENLADHPFFRDEYALVRDESIENILNSRRLRDTPSLPSSPEHSPAPVPASGSTSRGGGASAGGGGGGGRQKNTRKRPASNRSRANLAGLVGGDSDSSALTQDSGDEGVPTGSVVTATDGETVDGDDDDDRDETPDTTTATKRVRKSTKKAQSGRIRAGGSTRPTKKRKR